MTRTPASRFRRTLVAAAVVALSSGCATTAQDRPQEDGGIGGSIARAGEKTVGFGQTFVHRAGYLLGLHDDPGVPVEGGADVARAPAPPSTDPSAADPSAVDASRPVTVAARPAAAPSAVPVAKLPLHLDEVDLALMEEDAVMPGADAPDAAPAATGLPSDAELLAGADLDAGPGDAMDVLPFEDEAPTPDRALAAADPLDPLGLDAARPAPDAAPEPVAAAANPSPDVAEPAEPAPAVVAAADLEHRVGEEETLWDIAKKTTGDATNWHVLADVNDLGPGAAVFPGQTLTIPADMLRPELAGTSVPAPTPAPADAASPDGPVDVAAAAVPAPRLAVPTAPDSPSPVATPVTEPADGAREFEIAPGETLWDFAKRTTGDATNWQAIATQNGFDEGEAVAVRAGQRIFVPQNLVEERGAVASAVPAVEAEPVETADTTVATAAPAAADEEAFVPIPQVGDTRGVDETVDASAAALARANGANAAGEPASGEAPVDASGEDVRIVEASFTGGPEADLPADPAAGRDSVMVSGTYYPKAVYSDADFSAGLVTRVSPGTRLKVSSVDGQWYEVETERGTGWVHQRDIK